MSENGSLREGYLQIPFKGGWNDLSRWKRFGGTLERPAPPEPINVSRHVSDIPAVARFNEGGAG